eukprot:GSChrysophyteH1.ASY1.ANO1.670.1 assembled CDS
MSSRQLLHTQSTPGLLFNAASMKDLLVIEAILREETGNPDAHMRPKERTKKGGKKKSVSSNQTQMSIENAPVDPLERARMRRVSQNSVHVFAPIIADSNEAPIGGDDVSYLERQYKRVNTILIQNEQKITNGFDQLIGELSEEAKFDNDNGNGDKAKAPKFVEEDANLLLLFAGITEIDDDDAFKIANNARLVNIEARRAAAEQHRKKLDLEKATSKDKSGGASFDPMAAAIKFVEDEENGGVHASIPPSTTGRRPPEIAPTGSDEQIKGSTEAEATPIDIEEIDFSVWKTGVIAVLRQKLMAGILAEKRGQLAPNFVDLAEQSSVMMHSMAPPPKSAKVNGGSRPGTTGSNFDETVEYDPSTTALFGESSIAEDAQAGGGSIANLFPEEMNKSQMAKSMSGLDGKSSIVGKSAAHSKSYAPGNSSLWEGGGGSLFQASQTTAGDGKGLPPLLLKKKGTKAINRKKLQGKGGFNDAPGNSSLWEGGGGSLFQASQTTAGDGKGLPPLLLKKKGTKAINRKKLQGKGGFNDSFSRPTPRVLKSSQPKTSQSLLSSTGGISQEELLALREELANAKNGLRELDSMVDNNIAWVHNHCDVQPTALSDRTKQRCRVMALEKLFATIGGFIETTLAFAFLKWREGSRYDEVNRMAVVYTRAKSIEITTKVFSEALVRQYLKAWSPWLKSYAIQKRWEQEASAMELQRVARGFVGRRLALFRKKNVKAVYIQCMARVHRACKRVRHRRKFLRLRRAAVRIQEFFHLLVLKTKARKEVQRRRDLKAARATQALQKAEAARIKRAAEEKLKNEKADWKEVQRRRDLKAARATQALQKAEAARIKRAAEEKLKNEKAEQRRKATAAAAKAPKGSRGRTAPSASSGPTSAKSSPSKSSKTTTAKETKGHHGATKRPPSTGSTKKRKKDASKSPSRADEQLDEAAELAALEATAPKQPYKPMSMPGRKKAVKKPAAEPTGFDDGFGDGFGDGFDDPGFDDPKNAAATPSPAKGFGSTGSPEVGGTTTSFAVPSPDAMTKEHALRLKQEAEDFLIKNDPTYAEMMKQQKLALAAASSNNAGSPGSKSGSSSPSGGMFSSLTGGLFGSKPASPAPQPAVNPADFPDEEDEYLTPEQVAEQDRLRAIEAEEQLKRDKEQAYVDAQEAKAKLIADEREAKAKILAEKDRVEFEKQEAIRLEKEAAAEEERKRKEEEEEKQRLEDEALEAAELAKAEAAKAEKERIAKEEADKKLRDEIIAEARAAARLEWEAELKEKGMVVAGSQYGDYGKKKPQTPKRPMSARLQDGVQMVKNLLTPRSARRPDTAGRASTDDAIAEGDEGGAAKKGKKSKKGKKEKEPEPEPTSALSSMFSTLTSVVKVPKSLSDLSPIKTPLGPKGFNPETEVLIEVDLAMERLVRQARRMRAVARVRAQRELIQKEQQRAGRYIHWAVCLIQRTARGRQGRARFNDVREAVNKAIEELRQRSAVKIQCAVRRRLAIARVKQLWKELGEAQKRAEWSKYKEESGRKAKIKILAAGTPRKSRDIDSDDEPDITTWGIDPEQVNEMDEKIRRLEEIERNIEEKEKKMKKSQEESEKRTLELQEQLKKLEEKQKADEAERLMQVEMMKSAMGSGGPMQSGRSMMGTGGPRSAAPSARSVPASARSAPPSARSARGPEGIPADAPKMQYNGDEWVQLWDPDENATYWYCVATEAAQWEEPGTAPEYDYSSGYDTEGAMTDYSTDYYSGAETDYSEYQTEGEWQEFWDDAAQAKYWYNESTGEASWVAPELPPANVPKSARDFPDEWVSYIDETTNQEYWYNSKTGETSWA